MVTLKVTIPILGVVCTVVGVSVLMTAVGCVATVAVTVGVDAIAGASVITSATVVDKVTLAYVCVFRCSSNRCRYISISAWSSANHWYVLSVTVCWWWCSINNCLHSWWMAVCRVRCGTSQRYYSLCSE